MSADICEKNCQDTFAEVAESPRFNFVGNVQVGPQLPIQCLVPHYHAILFAYGASKDRELGLSGERNGKHIYSARAFVGWYNGLPEYHNLDPDLTAGEEAVIVGQGNVALDVARTLLTDIDVLKNTDITDHALQRLSQSRIKSIHIVGRRGPVQAAFTIKEIREMLQLPETSFKPIPEFLFPPDLKSLPRPQRRLLELLKKGSHSTIDATRSWSLDFLLSPHSLHWSRSDPTKLDHITFVHTQLADSSSPTSPLLPSAPQPSFLDIQTSTLFRSIGYKSEPLEGLVENGIPFDSQKGIFPNDGAGRIVSSPQKAHAPQEMTHEYGVPIPGLYCAGWVKRGPTGVIASTMTDAFITAEAIVRDWRERQRSGDGIMDTRFVGSEHSRGWDGVKDLVRSKQLDLKPVSWGDWKKIDQAERERGALKGGKPREKFTNVEEMLKILH
jgi:adrenodoxin-NADP+ reductase